MSDIWDRLLTEAPCRDCNCQTCDASNNAVMREAAARGRELTAECDDLVWKWDKALDRIAELTTGLEQCKVEYVTHMLRSMKLKAALERIKGIRSEDYDADNGIALGVAVGIAEDVLKEKP